MELCNGSAERTAVGDMVVTGVSVLPGTKCCGRPRPTAVCTADGEMHRMTEPTDWKPAALAVLVPGPVLLGISGDPEGIV